MSDNFKITNLGEPKEFLGIEIKRDRTNNKMFLSQESYIKKILERFRMSDCKPVSTPMVTRHMKNKTCLIESIKETGEKKFPYREAVGSLLYLAGGTRPDISYAANMVSRNSQNPTEEDWKEIKRIFRYIKGTSNLGLTFNGTNDKLIGFSDASYADSSDKTSTSGYVIKLLSDTVNWRCWKQKCVTTSTCEAEYVAMSELSKECMATKYIANRILNNKFTEILIFGDNKPSIDSTEKSGTPNLRHVNIRYYHIKQCIDKGEVTVKWISNEYQIADIFTKPLAQDKLEKLRDQILNQSIIS